MHKNAPQGWRKGIYPVRQEAEEGIRENALYIVEESGDIAGTFILRHRPETAYERVGWNCDFSYDKIYVIYTLAVHPSWQRHHVGDTIMGYILSLAKLEKMKAVRLDVYEKNMPAIRLYEKHGFQYIADADLGYGQYGLDRFRLYQYINYEIIA